VCAITAGFLLDISAIEWIAIIIVIGMVISAEIVNSSLERTADFIKAERDDRKRDIKDLGAAAVLICAITAAITGIIIFLPKLIALLAILLIFSGVIYMSGFYTINLSEDMLKEGFTLSETIGFEDPGSVLMAQPAENVPCVSIKNIRKDVDEIDGLHNEDYFAYTYYIRNEGESTVSFDWELELNSETKNLSSAVWVALYLDGKLSIFARTNAKTGKQETLPPLEMTDRGYSHIPLMTTSPESDQFQLITQKGDIKYYRVMPKDYESESIIVSGRVEDVEPMEIHKYTVVLWLEGDDPDADNSKIGGHLGTQMNFRLVGEEKESNSYMARLWKKLKFW
jgi:hypothetical protein